MTIETTSSDTNPQNVMDTSAMMVDDRITFAQLNQSAAEEDWYDVWLDYTVSELGFMQAALLVVSEQGSASRLKPVAVWLPDDGSADLLTELVDEAAYCESPVVMPQQQGVYGVAFPVLVQGRIKAVFSCEVHLPAALAASSDKTSSIENFMSRLEWFCFWIECQFHRQNERQQTHLIERQKTALDGYLSVSKAESWTESALQWADELASRFQCERVSIGFVKRRQVQLAVISGSSDGDLRSIAAKKIRLAMQEAYDQKCMINWPAPCDSDAHHIVHNTEKLSKSHHSSSSLTVPLIRKGETYAVVLLERSAEARFDPEVVDILESTLSLVGLILEDRRQGQLSFFDYSKAKLHKHLRKFVTPGFLKRKLALLVCSALLLFFSLAKGEYRVNADAELEPRLVRIVSAPFSGYIKAAGFRAGDRIAEGAELVAMEDRDLRLEKIKWLSQIEQDNKQYTESLAAYDRSKAQIILAKMAQSRAQLAVTESQLQRSVIKAPYDALIVSGDLSKRVGGAINQGEEMFQISPMSAYRLILYVSEYKIRDIDAGQQGGVVLSSMPGQSFDFSVRNVTPVTEVRDGGTYFRVEADLAVADPAFRPGLVGIGKIAIDRRLLIDIWTHDLRKWLSLKLWAFWG